VRGGHIYKDRRKSIRTRPLDRNDGAVHRVAAVKGPDRKPWNESCRQVSPFQVRDACGPHDGNEHTLRAIVSDGVHSAQQCGSSRSRRHSGRDARASSSAGQHYPRHPELCAPDVQRAHVLSRVDRHFSVYYRFYRHAIVTAVYNTEFGVDYFLRDGSRGYSFARSVRIAEVQNAGRPDERELPVGNDHGYMWRMNLYTRYLEKDNGVYIEIEFVALSRTIPRIFALLVNPYLRSIPREYLTNYIQATQRAVSPNWAY
jgi:hypothetical protein